MPSEKFTLPQLREIIDRQEKEIRELEVLKVQHREEIQRLRAMLKLRRSATGGGGGTRRKP